MNFPASSRNHQWKAVGKVEKQHCSVRTALGYTDNRGIIEELLSKL